MNTQTKSTKTTIRKTRYIAGYPLKVKEQTIRMTYKGKEVTPNNFDPAIHNLFTLLSWHKSHDGNWYTIPVNHEYALTDLDTFSKWMQQWGL